MLSEENILLDAFLNPDSILNKEEQTENDLKETKLFVDELKTFQKDQNMKMEETVREALQSVSKLKECNTETQEKYHHVELQRHLLGGSDIENFPDNLQRQHKTTVRKIAILVEGEQTNLDNLKNRHHETQETLNYLHELSALRDLTLSKEKRTLEKLTEKINGIEVFSEMKCCIVDKRTVKVIIFPSEDNDPHVNKEIAGNCMQLDVLLKFKSDNLNDLCAVELSESLKGADAIIEDAITNSDCVKLIVDLKRLWGSSASLFAEIHSIRKKYAIDWIPDKGTLHLMVKKGCSVVCTLRVPEGYPHSDSVSLINIVGDQSGTDVDSIQIPTDNSLTGWIIHLENIFNL